MCRNIKTLFNFEPPADEAEIRDAALQFVRKISGSRKPSRANQAVFDEAIDDISATIECMLERLTTSAAPKNREAEALKSQLRARPHR